MSGFIRQYREQNPNAVVVFTNGCFDLLHRGHVQYLEKAKEHGDILIVGLNSDRSVRNLKGPPRPVLTQEDRAFILSRLEAVDVVSVFDEETPYELIVQVQPDILIKGGDYPINEIVGRDIVSNRGGHVLTIPFLEGKSSTAIINIIRGVKTKPEEGD